MNNVSEQEFRFRTIGVIRSPWVEPADAPRQPVFSVGTAGRVELLPEYAAGLKDLEGFSHLHLIYVFHRATEGKLRVKPFLEDVEHGVFATRYPSRPNPIGMSIVRLVRCEGTVLHIEDVDVLNGTPLLDIKPYVPRFDVREGARSGWLEEVSEAEVQRRGRRSGSD